MALGIGAATAIAGGATATGGIIGSWLGASQAEKDREFNAEQARLNREFQRKERIASQEFELDMWNMNNEYNDIGSQIARARAAGVNPAAILNGEYKSATSAPVTTDAAPGSQATFNGGMGPAIMNGLTQAGAGLGDGIKSLVDSGAKIEEVKMTRDMINSNIQRNRVSMLKDLSDIGVNDVTIAQIENNMRWTNEKTPQEIIAIKQQVVNWTIDNYETLGQISVYEQTAKGLEIDNKYKDKVWQNQLSAEELELAILEQKKEFAKTIGVPIDTPEFLFNWHLALKNKFGDFCDKVILPAEQSKWKPRDWTVDERYGGKLVGTRYYLGDEFNPRNGKFDHNYFLGRSKFDALKKNYFSKGGKPLSERLLDAFRIRFLKSITNPVFDIY